MVSTFNPLVSIVIPVYNGSNYLREAIDSALAQTYKNIEIIVVNDGSTDNTEEIAKSYGNKIRYFKKENGGVSTALNLGIKEMKGEYFSWLSHDDMYYPDKIEVQVKFILNLNVVNKRKIILFSNYSLIDRNSRTILVQNFEKKYLLKKFNPLYPLLNGLVGGCTLLIPKFCFRISGLFSEKLKITQDYDLWFKMFPKFKIYFLKKTLVKTRIHNDQTTKSDPNVNNECSKLWFKMVDSISDKEKKLIFGSVEEFYRSIYHTVALAGYIKIEKYLEKFVKDDDIKKNIHQKKYLLSNEKKILDKIYSYPIIGSLLVRLYLKVKKIFKNDHL